MIMTIEDIKKLVELEKDSEQNIRKAKEEAENIIKKSKEDAQRILDEAEDQKYYDDIFVAGLKEINEKKKLLEKETEKKIEQIRKIAKKNLEKTASLIVTHILGE
jgi:vacuolar-type H+-ATPase subunit H